MPARHCQRYTGALAKQASELCKWCPKNNKHQRQQNDNCYDAIIVRWVTMVWQQQQQQQEQQHKRKNRRNSSDTSSDTDTTATTTATTMMTAAVMKATTTTAARRSETITHSHVRLVDICQHEVGESWEWASRNDNIEVVYLADIKGGNTVGTGPSRITDMAMFLGIFMCAQQQQQLQREGKMIHKDVLRR